MNIGILVRFYDNKIYVNTSYIEYFKKFGFHISILTPESNFHSVDVILLPGGYDLDPSLYYEKNTFSKNIIKENDRFDFKAISLGILLNKKIIGICRGIQSINVYFDGSLKQNINHHSENNHFITYKNRLLLVNSFHHQSILKLGDGLKILSKSLDDEIEIIRNKKIIGVQFHPERMSSPIINTLFLEFITEV